MNKKTIIGIDPGASGGIAVFGNGKITAVPMPKKEVRTRELDYYFKFLKETYDDPIIFIEKVQAYRGKEDDEPGKKFGINKMLANYSELLTLINLSGIQFVEVYPISWQTTLGLRIKGEKMTKTERKNRYKKFAENSFPEIEKVTLAISDALCLVQFGLQKYSSDPEWIEERIQNKTKNKLFK